MEPVLRGHVERILDNTLTDSFLDIYYKTFRYFEETGMIGSSERALFGLIFASVFHGYRDLSRLIGRESTEEAVAELMSIFEPRSSLLRSRLSEITRS